jgi:hypothetical protein
MSAANEPAACPTGHHDTVRLLSVFAGVNGDSRLSPAPAAAPAGGCGAACGCHH